MIQSFIHASNPCLPVKFFRLLSLDDVDYYTNECHYRKEFYEPKFVFLLLFFGLAGQIQLLQNFCKTNSCNDNLFIGDLPSYIQIFLGYYRFISPIFALQWLVNVLLSNLMSLVGPAGNFTDKIILYNQPICGEDVFISQDLRRLSQIKPCLIIERQYHLISFRGLIFLV